MHEDVHETAQWLGKVVNGWLNYYAVPTSTRTLRSFRTATCVDLAPDLASAVTEDPDDDGPCGTPHGVILAPREGSAPLARHAVCRQPPEVGAVCVNAHVRI